MKLLVLVAIQLYTFRCVIAAGVDTCDTIYLLNVVPWPNSEYPGWSAGKLAAEQRTDLLNGYKLEVINIEAERSLVLAEGYSSRNIQRIEHLQLYRRLHIWCYWPLLFVCY